MAERVTTDQVDAVMSAARVLVGVIAASVAAVEDAVTVPQFRVLAMTATHGPLSVGDVARVLAVHPSNATRTVDRLVGDGLLDRRDSPRDRRQVELTLTPAGRDLVGTVMRHRRATIRAVLKRMSPADRSALVPAMRAFGQAGEPAEDGLWPVPVDS